MAFALTRGTYLTDDQVARSQFVAAELCLRNVHILVADSVVGGSQEADAFAHDLQNAAAQFNTFFLRLCLADHHGKCLFLQAVGIRDIESLCNGAQLGKRFVLKFKYFQSFSHWVECGGRMKYKIAQNASSIWYFPLGCGLVWIFFLQILFTRNPCRLNGRASGLRNLKSVKHPGSCCHYSMFKGRLQVY